MEAAETEKRTSRYSYSNFSIMKIKASIFILTILTFGLLISCNKDNPVDEINLYDEIQETSSSQSRGGVTLSEKEIDYVQSEMKNGMVSFVESVHPIYEKGMDSNDFTNALIGEKNARNITQEGKNLLDKAFVYLDRESSTEEILKVDTGVEMASALLFVKKYNYEKKSEDGDFVLFGNTTGDTFPSDDILSTSRKCKWYQIGCHLSNIWNWLVENHETVLAVLTTISTIIGMF